MITNRRRFLFGAGATAAALVAAPAIVRVAANLMPIKPLRGVTWGERSWIETRAYEGLNLRLIKGYDNINDLAQWRFDVLYGVIGDQPLITRIGA